MHGGYLEQEMAPAEPQTERLTGPRYGERIATGNEEVERRVSF